MSLRPLLTALTTAVLAVLAFVPIAPAAGRPLTGQFQLFFGRSTAHPCVPGAYVCGVGSLDGLGQATMTMTITGVSVFDGTCVTLTADEVITMTDGSGTLTLAEAGTFCAPSAAAVRLDNGLKSFGNPYAINLTYAVSGGSGVFNGASGTGVVSGKVAGESGQKTVTGTY
jgi:hypothetical protein